MSWVPRRRSYSSYNDGCAAAHALDLVGERWALLVVRELLLGPKRFNDLQRDVSGISATALTQRLRDLERQGVVEQEALPAPARVPVYRLTPWGRRLEDVITALSMWGAQSPELPREADMSPDTVILAMRAHARPDAGLEGDRRVEIQLTDVRHDDAAPVTYTATLGPAECSIVKGTDPGADAHVATDSRTWQHLVFGVTTLPKAIASMRLAVTPAGTAARRLAAALLKSCGPTS